MKDKIKWPAGNRLDLCIPLRKITVTDEGTQFGEYIPSQAAVVMVYLVGNYASYEYTPRIEDNKLFITDNGELKPGVYAIDVRIQEPERKLRSFRCGELEIVRETRQLALGDFVLNNNVTLDADAFIFGEGPSAYEVAVRDGYTGTKAEWLESMRGKEGRGIADIVALPTGAFRILLTDGSAYVTPILKGEQGVSIVDFTVSSITSQEVLCTITMSDGTTRTANLPRGEKGEQGDAGEDGRGIQSVVMNNDYTITFSYTDGTSYTTPQALRGEQGAAGQDGQDGRGISSMTIDNDNHLTVSYTDGTTYTTPQSLQGERGVSITDFEQVGESATMCFYNISYSNGNISQIGLPKGEQGDRGETGPQGIKGDTVVLGEVGEYKLYNIGGTATDGAMTQDATTKAIAASNGYYECGTAAGTAAKIAIGDNEALYTLQKGGSVKVKMTNANAAASGVTLKIGSAAATPLYYNGEAVSSSNTWEAGEVVEVYYDGTNYQASNSQGGGGKAEKIKYDNSQGTLVSNNVQDALEELGDAIFEISESRISAGSSTQQYYTYNNGVIGKTNNSNYRCWPPVDITGYNALSLKFYLAEGSAKTFYTDENNIIVGDFLTNTSGDFKKYIIPQGARKLYFSVNYNAQTDVAIYGLNREFGAQKVSYNNSQGGLSSTNVQDALDEIAQNSAEKATFNDVVDRATFKCVTLYDPYKSYNTNKGWIDPTGTVHAVSTSIYRYTGFIKVNERDIIHIHSNISSTAAAVLSTWDSSKSFIMAIISDGSGNQDIVYTIPSGVSYIRLTALVNEPSFTAKIELNAKNMLGDGLHTIQEITPVYIGGYAYINTSGEYVSGGSSYKYTHPIKVLENDEIFVFSTMSTGGCAIAGYTSNNLQISNSYTIGSEDANSPQWHKYTVPSGIEWIRVCHRYSDDGAIKVYIRRKVEKMPKKSIKVLFIGNSVNQDAVTYLPILMREYAPDVDYQFYIWYKGGYSLAQHLSLWNNNSNPDIFSVCKNGSSWANYSSITMAEILNTYDFDIVQLQEYCHYKDVTNQSVLDDTLNTFNDCIEWIQNHYNKPFKVATLFHQPFLNISDGIDADTVYTRTKAIVEMYLKKTVTELLNPAGISMYRAMAIPELDALGNQGHLSPDARHAQEGLPCMMLSYVTAMWLLKQIGVQISCVNTQTVVTPNNYYQLNIPGSNPHTVTDADIIVGTTEQIRLSQLVAVKALKEGEYIRNQALTEYT